MASRVLLDGPPDGRLMALCMQVGWKLFDKDGKGHIDASDLRRVCLEMGYKVCGPHSPSLPPPLPNGLQVFGLPSPLLPSLPPPPHSPLPPRSPHSQVSDRDIENMLTVMSPSLAEHHQHGKGAGGGASAADEGGGAHGGAITEEAGTVAAKISFERYKMTMQSSFTRTFQRGQYVIAL